MSSAGLTRTLKGSLPRAWVAALLLLSACKTDAPKAVVTVKVATASASAEPVAVDQHTPPVIMSPVVVPSTAGAAPTTAPGLLTATKDCKSVWDTPAWEAHVAATGDSYQLPTVTAGKQYSVVMEPGGQQGGLVPNNFTGPFALAAAADEPDNHHGGYEFDPSCFQ